MPDKVLQNLRPALSCSIGKVPILRVIGPLLPFIGVMVVALVLITYLPEMTLFLPRLFGYL